MHSVRRLLIFVLIVAAAGCATLRGSSPHPLEGDWTYRVVSEGDVYEGVFSLTETEAGLEGTITGDGMDASTELLDLSFEEPELKFAFRSPEYGLLRADVDVAGDAYSGTLYVPEYSTTLTMRGQRVAE